MFEAQKELLENLVTEKLISLGRTVAEELPSDYCNRDKGDTQCTDAEYLIDLKNKLKFAHGGRRVYSKKTRKNRKH
jgi:hypothetical protein